MITRKRDQLLRLEVEGFRERMIDLLDELGKKNDLQQEFVSNPCGVLAERVTGAEVTRHQVSEANRLMFAILANTELVKWLDAYELEERPINKEEFAREFSDKLMEFDDGTIIGALISNAAVENGMPGFGQSAYQCVCNEIPSKTSCACTPVSKDTKVIGKTKIDPNTLRSLSEALIKRANELKRSDALNNLSQLV